MLALLDTTVEYSYRLANYIQRLVFNFSDIESNKDFNQAQLNNYQAFLTYNIYENYSFIKCVCEIYDGVFAGVLCLHYIRLKIIFCKQSKFNFDFLDFNHFLHILLFFK